ncbi:MAG: 2-C-methyl-D-erythritol 2,4-cyclodiphosphate synthase [Proteobacteria bacterium]|nr:2-C-methyl-D-erythritol 2,4-cyclodiphosphate synthase [Pseudomonadota bacterium]
MRIGQGFDVHPFGDNIPLVIGGVKIPFHKGLIGHSDADVLLHAICDCLLGAASLRDIGYHFSDSDPQFRTISSRKLVLEVYHKIKNEGYDIVNLDCTVILEKPKIASFIPGMVQNISEDLEIDSNQINIKAKTSEKLGYLGRGEGVAAQTICLLKKR